MGVALGVTRLGVWVEVCKCNAMASRAPQALSFSVSLKTDAPNGAPPREVGVPRPPPVR